MEILQPADTTIGKLYNPAISVKTVEEAREYFVALVARRVLVDSIGFTEAQHMERQNIVYYAGYMSDEGRIRILELYSQAHPIFRTGQTD